jgi:hypothetical protein
MNNIYLFLPRLTVNSRFIHDFITADAPCCALGLVEERKQTYSFLALRPKLVIPDKYTHNGFSFGHSLLGNTEFVVVHFAFHFYGYGTFNVLLNPNNPMVQTVLDKMLETGDYFIFAVDPKGSATAFRSELGQEDLTGLKNNLPLIKNARTTGLQYQKALAAFQRNPEPPGAMLNWVCHDDASYLDLTLDRRELNPAPQPVKSHPKNTVPHEAIENRLIPCEYCGQLAVQLIFADDSVDSNELEECAKKMLAQYSGLNVPTWIIGEPLGTPGFDTKTRIMKVWPNRGSIQLKTADEFNGELDELLAQHCKPWNESVQDREPLGQQPQWQPISMLPVFTDLVDGMLAEAVVQLGNMRRAVDKPHVLDDATLNRVFELYNNQLDDQKLFMEQFFRWQQGQFSPAQAKEVERLVKQSATLKIVNEEILEIAGNIKHATIDKILAMDELELAIAVLLGKIKLP